MHIHTTRGCSCWFSIAWSGYTRLWLLHWTRTHIWHNLLFLWRILCHLSIFVWRPVNPDVICAGPIEFVEADLSTLPPLSGTPDLEKKEIPILEKPKKEGTGGEVIRSFLAYGSRPAYPKTSSVSTSCLDTGRHIGYCIWSTVSM